YKKKQEPQQLLDFVTEKGIVFADIFDYYIDAYYNLDINKAGAALHDPLAVGVAVDPNFVTLLPLNMMVDVNDGRTIGDPSRLRDPHKNNYVAVEVDEPFYLERFMNYTRSEERRVGKERGTQGAMSQQ